jgi:hypothetical protein
MRPSLEVMLSSYTVYYALVVTLALALCFRILKWHTNFPAAADGQPRSRLSDSNRTGER